VSAVRLGMAKYVWALRNGLADRELTVKFRTGGIRGAVREKRFVVIGGENKKRPPPPGNRS